MVLSSCLVANKGQVSVLFAHNANVKYCEHKAVVHIYHVTVTGQGHVLFIDKSNVIYSECVFAEALPMIKVLSHLCARLISLTMLIFSVSNIKLWFKIEFVSH